MNTLEAIDLVSLGSVSGGAAPVTADNFMPRAEALQSLYKGVQSAPTAAAKAKLQAQVNSEFCGALYPYAKAGKPINSMFGGIARSQVVSNGDKVCK